MVIAIDRFSRWAVFWSSAGYYLISGDGQRASKSGHSNYQVFMFGSYFGLRVDIWLLGVQHFLGPWLSLNGIGTCQLTPELSLWILVLAN